MDKIIIDAHVHRYSDEVLKDPFGWAERHGEMYWNSLVCSNEEHQSIQGWADREGFLNDMDAAGVRTVVMLGWYWEHQQTCRIQNEWHTKWIKEDPEKFIAFASVQPRDGAVALDDLKRVFDRGVKGVGEVFPAAQGFSIQDKYWLSIVEFCVENSLPINMHVTEQVGNDYHGKINEPWSDYYWLAKEYPELKLILAHWGGLMPFCELNSGVKGALKNVFYDTAASPLLYDPKVFRSVVDVIGAGKVLYGSDYPLRVYPRRQKEPNFTNFLDEICKSGLGEEELEAILGGNIKRLLLL